MKKFKNISLNEVKTILNEEMGIANEVVKLSNEAYNCIKSGKNKCVLSNGVKFEYGDFDGYSGYSAIKNKIQIDKSVNLTDSVLKDSISHEIEHMWQVLNKKSGLHTQPYEVAIDGMRRGYGAYQAISMLYYYSRRFEIDAYCNGVYGSEQGKSYYGTFEDFIDFTNLDGIFKTYNMLFAFFTEDTFNSSEFAYAWKEFVKRSKLKPNLDGKKVVLKLLKNGYRYLLRKSARLYSLIVSQNSKKWEDLSDFEKMEYNRSISARKIKN